MPQLDIVCATWNTENESPENPEIVKFYDALWKKRNQNAPDFVVIGLQETVPDKKTNEWVADMCLRTAGSDMKPIMDRGKPVKGPSIMGKTNFVSVTWRVHRVHDGLYAFCSCEDGGSVKRITLHPLPSSEPPIPVSEGIVQREIARHR